MLTARSVKFWDENQVRWVLLEGKASALQGVAGLRADRALARVETVMESGSSRFEVEIFAEGDVQITDGPTRRVNQWRMSRGITGKIQIKASDNQPTDQLTERPPELDLLARGFPAEVATPAQAAPDIPEAPAALVLEETPPIAAVDAPIDSAVTVAQFDSEGFSEPRPGLEAPENREEIAPFAPGRPGEMTEPLLPGDGDEGFEGGEFELAPETELPQEAPGPALGPGPVLRNTRRVVSIYPKDSGGLLTSEVDMQEDGRATIYLRGGLNVVTEAPGQGIVDVTADNAVIWTRLGDGGSAPATGATKLDLDPRQPLEIYLEGNVIFRQDKRQFAGPGDQKVVEAEQFYMDFRNESFVANQARLNIFDSRFITPIRINGQEIQQFRPLIGRAEAGALYGPTEIHADRTMMTGSRFPTPGYQFRSRSVDLLQVDAPILGPDGKPAGNPENPLQPSAPVWEIDARNNSFFVGPVPLFWWPRILTETDDLDPPISQIQIRANNYFGQQVLTDWSVYKLLGRRKPSSIDRWTMGLDYLSERGIAVGTDLGWSGKDLVDNLFDPYNDVKTGRSIDRPYFGYLDAWGLRENRGVDTLGTGPAVITNGPPGSGDRGFQRDSAPSFQDYRGRFVARHMQSFLPSGASFDEDIRLQLETGYLSDRHFLEQYYKNLFDTGLDPKTLGYFIYQKENRAFTVLASANLQTFFTDTQYYPKVEYKRLGDSVLWDYMTWSQTWGVDYANVHTDQMVNNPNLFAFQPFDPTTATSGAFQTGRVWTAHDLQLPIDLNVMRLVPYAQGQAVGWDNQYATSLPNLELAPTLPPQDFIRGPQGSSLGRLWGAVGARANMMAWRNYPGAESELLNVHGLSHKVNFDLDYRYATSTEGLNRIGLQDELDDNTYEFVRRYFALVNYRGGVLPPQYDPRYLTLRRAVSPITGTTDIQDSIQTVQAGIHQRLQTKRGPEGRRRIVDFMILDLQTTYFPEATRDNFGEAWGQNQYNWEWYLGDRVSLISYGWFEFFDITGDPILASNPTGKNDPFGLSVITGGISINRPPRGSVFFGYSVINTGPIATSALNVSFSYWLSPKWYSSFGTSYDFGNAILLGSTFGVTRIGADFLTSVGLTIDPQRNSYMFGFELTPRLSPSIKFGSGGGIARFDSRYAATQ